MLGQQPVIYHPGSKDGSKEVDDNTGGQGDGKALDWAGSKEEQGYGGYKSGNMGVYDGPEGLVITPVNKCLKGFSKGPFLPHALKDQHVGVNPHTNDEYDAGYAGKGQCGLEKRQNSHKKEQVQDHGYVRYET